MSAPIPRRQSTRRPSHGARGRPVSGLAPRSVAAALLEGVLDRRRPLDEVMAETAGFSALEPRDRAFAHLMAATALRHLGEIDALVARFLQRRLPRSAGRVRHILRLGAAQLLWLRTPPHAAIGTAVALAVADGLGGFKGLVNAILHRLSEQGPDLLAGLDAVALDAPAWLFSRLEAEHGADAARAILAAGMAEAALDLTLRHPEEAGPWAERLEAVILPTGSLRRAAGGAVDALPGFAEGAWWVQDAAAALPARLLGARAGERVADLCAAPGGKTAQLAAAGAHVTAVELSPQRAGRLRANLDRLGLEAEIVVADATAYEGDRPFDRVLVDAPCSATGTMRRHPDLPHLRREAELPALVELQARLLARAASLVRPGGTLVWCTCSLLREEGEAQIERLLAAGAPLVRSPIAAAEIGGLAGAVTQVGEVRTLPSLSILGENARDGIPDGLDGFHIARLVRPDEGGR